MDVAQILEELDAREIRVRVEGEALALEGPKGSLPPELAEEIRRRKPELLEVLARRDWPESCLEAVTEFGGLRPRLLALVGQAVVTPRGQGRLLQAFADRAVVRLAGRVSVFLPSEVRPPGVEVQAEDHFEVIH